jgi:hypothetical protein
MGDDPGPEASLELFQEYLRHLATLKAKKGNKP